MEALELIMTGSFNQYLADIQKIPVLTKSEEIELFAEYYKERDSKIAHRITLHNLRFVVHTARQLDGYGIPLEELVQEGNIGLMVAISKFDTAKGVKLISYAVHYIRSSMTEFILLNYRSLKVATTKAHRKLFFNIRKGVIAGRWLSAADIDDMSEKFGVSEKIIREMEQRLSSTDLSYAPAIDDEEGVWESTPSTYLTSSASTEPLFKVENDNHTGNLITAIENAMDSLKPRERDIIESRHLSDNPCTLSVLAEKHGISKERVRQLQDQTLKKVRPFFTEVG